MPLSVLWVNLPTNKLLKQTKTSFKNNTWESRVLMFVIATKSRDLPQDSELAVPVVSSTKIWRIQKVDKTCAILEPAQTMVWMMTTKRCKISKCYINWANNCSKSQMRGTKATSSLHSQMFNHNQYWRKRTINYQEYWRELRMRRGALTTNLINWLIRLRLPLLKIYITTAIQCQFSFIRVNSIRFPANWTTTLDLFPRISYPRSVKIS